LPSTHAAASMIARTRATCSGLNTSGIAIIMGA
jgi:hypothetical protein